MSRFILTITFCIITSFQAFATEIDCSNKHCLAVVDAGSSGSRLHVYSYELDNSGTPITIHEELTQKYAPGISTIRSDINTVNAYMDGLFKDVKAQNVPVYFYATAGMRLISTPDQKRYYKNIEQWFASHTGWKLLEAKTIPGNDEGLYGWLATNQQLGRLNSDQDYVSFMDMGGASVQIVIPINNEDNVQAKEKDVVQVNLYGRHQTLFVHSFLGLGQTEVSHQSLDQTACYSNDYEMPDNLIGKGDVLSCQNHMARLINDVHNVNDIVKPVLDHAPKTEWYATGGVAYTVADNIFQFSDNTFTNKAFLDKAETAVCHQPWSELSEKYPKNDFLSGYCLYASYYYTLMVNGYGLSSSEKIHYLKDMDWTLGVVLMHKEALHN